MNTRIPKLNREEIIRMAREAGWDMEWGGTTIEQVTAFAALVAAAEREACADFLEHGFIDDDDHHLLYAREIRARGHV